MSNLLLNFVTMSQQKRWQDIAKERKRAQEYSIPSEWRITLPEDAGPNMTSIPARCGILTTEEVAITEETDVGTILHNLATKKWSAFAVTTAYLKRAIVAHQLTNCLTEIFIESAQSRARFLDEHLATTGQVLGPLHGLPISLKDQFCIKGVETIMGYVSWVGRIADKNAVLVDMLLEAGAIPFVRTNVPQSLMWGETYNHVFGRTTNPYNIHLTSGGSSGGEGALIGLKGSPLGVGTDIGGSVRIPAAFCNIYALRPSYNRLPYQGAVNSMAGQESVTSVLGPMSNSISGLKIFVKAILDGRPWDLDPLVPRLPWNQAAYELVEHGSGGRLCFGLLLHDQHTMPHPPIIRALEAVREALTNAGHQVIDWSPYRHKELYDVQWLIETADMAQGVLNECSATGEPFIISMEPKDADAALNAPPGQDPPQKPSPFHPKHLTTYELWKLHELKRQLRKDYLDEWQASVKRTNTGRPIDALITPVAPFVAPLHGKNDNYFYTMLFNSLDYPTIAFPVGFVDKDKDISLERTKFFTPEDRSNHEMYSPETFHGAPIGLQIATRTQEEEALLGMMEVIDKALRRHPMLR